jgi:hypothetical protein
MRSSGWFTGKRLDESVTEKTGSFVLLHSLAVWWLRRLQAFNRVEDAVPRLRAGHVALVPASGRRVTGLSRAVGVALRLRVNRSPRPPVELRRPATRQALDGRGDFRPVQNAESAPAAVITLELRRAAPSQGGRPDVAVRDHVTLRIAAQTSLSRVQTSTRSQSYSPSIVSPDRPELR